MNGHSVNGLPGREPTKRALLVVTDGLGYDPATVRDLARRVIGELGPHTRRSLLDFALEVSPGSYELLDIARLSMMPIVAEGLSPSLDWRKASETVRKVRAVKGQMDRNGMMEEVEGIRRRLAMERRYIPWIAEEREWSAIVDENLTVPTETSGVWVGYEDADPPVQGNSETGHQQIGNLALAPQIPLQITRSIEDGSFFENSKLKSAIEDALAEGKNVNFCFLLSGIRGSDGRVHSAWNHLEAFCDLLFSKIGASPDRVRMQAILDGRDAPAHGSLEIEGIDGGYLGELERLLERHGAVESLAWVIGRSLSMDRDYREENARCDYLLLTEGDGELATGFHDIIAKVKEVHDAGFTDADVPAIALNHGGKGIAKIETGDAFINLNFRSDRQRSKTASLCGARPYLVREALAHGRTWQLDWMRDDLELRICTIAEYDAEFERDYGVEIAYPIAPHQLNFLSRWQSLMPEGEHYLLVAESVKATHMGYFVRGRREAIQGSFAEDRQIVTSDGTAQGVMSDSDFYLNPGMQTTAIAERVSQAMSERRHRLIMCNLAAPDMVGHLLPTRFEGAIEAYRETVTALAELSATAKRCGYSMVVTSDHGNIENDAPTHTVNPVLTTVIPAEGQANPREESDLFTATLFDISHTLATIVGANQSRIAEIIAVHRGDLKDEFIGKSIVC